MSFRRRAAVPFALLLATLSGCSSKDSGADPGGSPGPTPEPIAGHPHNGELPGQRCPGDPGCPASEDPTLYAGAAVADITPDLSYVVQHVDGSNDWEFNEQAGDTCIEKATGNPVSPDKCTWLAGFDSGRPAKGVHDATSVRCVVLKQGETKVGLCTVDCIGWFYNEVQRTRDLIAQSHPELDLDLLVMAATHVHETQDTLGIWGPDDGTTGSKPSYNQHIREQAVAALVDANKALVAVKAQFGAISVDGSLAGTDPAGKKTQAFVSDTRDPVVLDNELRTVRFVDASDKTVATMINFTSHPEFSGSENVMVTADWPGGLRDAVEKGIGPNGGVQAKDPQGNDVSIPGIGGVALLFNGALGGQVGPGEVKVYGFDGVLHDNGEHDATGPDRARTEGALLAAYALASLQQGATTVETAPLGFRAHEIYLDVHNKGYHVAIAKKLFDRDAFFYDPTKPLSEDNLPAIKTQEVVLDLGPAEMISIPGELHAELLLATRDGKTSLDAPYPFTPAPYSVLNDKTTNPHCGMDESQGGDGHSRCDDGPPAIAQMDRSAVLDLARDPKAKFRWVLGLGQDEAGYVVPEYDYKLDPSAPYFDEASPGDHYEETNSVGPNVQKHVCDPLRQLLRSDPVIQR